MSPIVTLTLVPAIAALILGYTPLQVAFFIKEGMQSTISNAILFIFSVIFFGIMSDAGMFDVIVDFLVKKAGNNVIAVTVATAIIATIAHLDGTTAVTVLITIPAMLPIYRKMNINVLILLCITGACMGVMNLLPWGGPVARAATVLEMDATALWHTLIPIQIAGCVMNIAFAVFLGMRAIKQGAGAGKGVEVEVDKTAKEKEEALKRPKLLIFNILFTVAVIGILATGWVTSYVVFMVGVCIALTVNYPNQKIQDTLINAGCKIYMAQLEKEASVKDGELDIDADNGMQLKEVSVEDLLPRQQIKVDMNSVEAMLTGKKVLITGSAGSIGAEIVRQVAAFHPAKMMLIDAPA